MLPNQYKWLLEERAPKMLVEALALYGVKETIGDEDNPQIIAWARECAITDYEHDATPWCGLVMAVVARRAGKEVVSRPLWALNWANFGIKTSDGAMLGDVLTFKRAGGGHVALYVGEDAEAYHVLGGNQSDQVNIMRISKDRLYSVRRPMYSVQPPNVRKILLENEGIISVNEK